MKRNVLLTAATLFALSFGPAQADTKEDLMASIKKLAEKGNYSWTSTSKRPERPGDDGDRRRGPSVTNGKTADGLVLLMTERGDRTTETLIKGEKVAVKRDEGWTVIEPRGEGDRGDGPRRGGRGFGFGRNFRNYEAPAAEAEELLGKVAELKKEGEAYVGELTEEGAQSLLAFGRGRRGGDDGNRPSPTGVKASAKFWLADGVLSKYETSVTGSISFNGNERDLSRVNTVEIKDVGSTKIDVPEETKAKLSSE